MKVELQEALYRDFPKLYRQHSLPMNQTCMCWGFECDDGWEPLIRSLSEKLEGINQLLPDEQYIEATQVKEKYGTLRFYTRGNIQSVGVYNLIEDGVSEAERQSAITCESCGKKGKNRSVNGWWATTCIKCYRKRPGYENIKKVS